jgi:hypothetical protein
MATRSLSPNQITQRLLKHRLAVATLARQAAIKAVKQRLRADGIKLSQVPAKTIRTFANAYFDVHHERLIAEVKQIIAPSPLFAPWHGCTSSSPILSQASRNFCVVSSSGSLVMFTAMRLASFP